VTAETAALIDEQRRRFVASDAALPAMSPHTVHAHRGSPVRRRTVLASLLALCLGATLLAFLPGSVDRATLSGSVGSAVSDAVTIGLGYNADCRPARPGWRCVLITTDESDSGVTYDVTTSGNCWSAVLSRSAGMLGLPSRAKDCIHLIDQLTD
jgi:hypothetical protein